MFSHQTATEERIFRCKPSQKGLIKRSKTKLGSELTNANYYRLDFRTL